MLMQKKMSHHNLAERTSWVLQARQIQFKSISSCGFAFRLVWATFLQTPTGPRHGWIAMSSLSLAGDRQTRALRKAFFSALLRQEVALFDRSKVGELTNRMSSGQGLLRWMSCRCVISFHLTLPPHPYCTIGFGDPPQVINFSLWVFLMFCVFCLQAHISKLSLFA